MMPSAIVRAYVLKDFIGSMESAQLTSHANPISMQVKASCRISDGKDEYWSKVLESRRQSTQVIAKATGRKRKNKITARPNATPGTETPIITANAVAKAMRGGLTLIMKLTSAKMSFESAGSYCSARQLARSDYL